VQTELKDFLNGLLPTLAEKAKTERLTDPVIVEIFDDIQKAGRHCSFTLDGGTATKWIWAENPQPVLFPLRVVLIGDDGETVKGFLRERGGWRTS
jgi:hypothetical protein